MSNAFTNTRDFEAQDAHSGMTLQLRVNALTYDNGDMEPQFRLYYGKWGPMEELRFKMSRAEFLSLIAWMQKMVEEASNAE